MHSRRAGLAALVLAGGIGAGAAFYLIGQSADDESGRFESGATRVVVSNLANVPCTLFRAGGTLEQSVGVRAFDGSPLWLPPGNYYLRATHRSDTSFFPIPLTGYRSGPDRDGSFLVAIRSSSSPAPPALSADLPPFVRIPSGTFLIGDRQNPNEPHCVWLPTFCIAPFELSNAEFRVFLEAPDGYDDVRNWTDEGLSWKSSATGHSTALLAPSDPEYRRCGRPDQPVTWVSWFEALAFCRWMTRTHGKGEWQFDLPSEAEWEKAARGPDSFDYGLGNRVSDDEAALYNWKKNTLADETVVGWISSRRRFQPNRYGLFHMTGNVVEWTRSLFESYSRQHPYTEGARNRDNATGSRVARGGSWYSASIANLSLAYRDAFQPSHSSQELGFRIVARPLP